MPSRRSLLKLCLAMTALAIVAIATFVTANFVVLSDQWNRPTDFAEQMVALSRERQKLGPEDVAGTVQFIEVLAAMRNAHADATGLPLRVERGEYVYDYAFLSEDSENEADLEAMMLALESRGFFAAFDKLATDPRVLPGIVIYSVDTDARWNNAEFKYMRDIFSSHAQQAINAGEPETALADVRRQFLLGQIMMVQPPSETNNLGRAATSRALWMACELAKNDATSDAQRAQLIEMIAGAHVPTLEQSLEIDRLWVLAVAGNALSKSIWFRDDRGAQLAYLDAQMQHALEVARSTESLAEVLKRVPRPPSRMDRLRYRLPEVGEEGLHIAAALHTAIELQRHGATAQIAIERYRRTHNGELPPSLDALVPECLPHPLSDPLNPDGYVYRIVEGDDGPDYVLYSKNLDGVDNNLTRPSRGTKAFEPEALGTDIDIRIK